MGERVKTFSDGSFLEFDQGRFDGWCVYFTESDGSRGAPKDVDCFGQLKQLAEKYGAKRVYDDYVGVYDITGNQVEKSSLAAISEIAASYGTDTLEADVIFSILYMTMIAEERRRFTRLGKRIKRLGVYELLIKNRSVDEAADFMRGMGGEDIAKLCEARGF